MKIYNPITQQHEILKLISKDVQTDPNGNVETSTEIYELSHGDFLIISTQRFLKIESPPFVTEHGITKKWLDMICKAKNINSPELESAADDLKQQYDRCVSTMLSEDYKTGYFEGIDHLTERLKIDNKV